MAAHETTPACIGRTHIGPCGAPDCWAIPVTDHQREARDLTGRAWDLYLNDAEFHEKASRIVDVARANDGEAIRYLEPMRRTAAVAVYLLTRGEVHDG